MAHSPRLVTRGWLLPRQCVSCDDESPTCNCAADENCVLTSRTCSQCPTIQCNKKPSNNGAGVNPGVITGPVVAILVIASLVLFWYLRRKKRRDLARLEELAARARKAEIAGFHLSQPGSPAPGSARSLPSARSGNSRQSARRSQKSPLPPTAGLPEQYGYEAKDGGNGARDPFSDGGSFNSRGTGTTNGGASENIIPIQYIPPSGSDDSLSGGGGGGNGRPKSQAARTLNEARENLWKVGAPQRPARAPGLDLRLNNARTNEELEASRSPSESAGRIRDSYLSGTSGAPSFSSGYTTDLHTDAPKIFTSKHVQLGRFQQAEVVQFGHQQQLHPPPPLPNGQISNMDVLSQNSKLSPAMVASSSSNYEGPTPISPSLSAVRSPYSPPSANTNQRTLTPQNQNQRRYDDTEAEEMPSPDPNHHPTQNTSPTDLRFSMGSLAYRDSISSMGTDRYLARPESHGSAFGPPRHPWTRGERESMMSGRSDSDSVLGGYPMIPPHNTDHQLSTGNGIPQSTSVATLDSHTLARGPPPPPPPPTYRSPKSPIRARPQTATSIADSLLGSFPFVPPNNDDLADLPSAQIPETAAPTTRNKGTMIGASQSKTARNTAMSGVSEGLGGFEFRFEDGEEVPPLPSQAGNGR